MKKINDLLKDPVYDRILNKFKDGKYTYGKEYIDLFSSKLKDFNDLNNQSLYKYFKGFIRGRVRLCDIPNSIKSEDFCINTFFYDDVFEYIKSNSSKFSKDFYKTLIMKNPSKLINENNIFEIIPSEYIDDEMISLAILNSTNFDDFKWFITVCKRKIDAISRDVWHLAARLYGSSDFLTIIYMTPEKYKDEEWYLELLKCTYSNGQRRDYKDDSIMNCLPEEKITESLLTELFLDNSNNVARFNEEALEKRITVNNFRAPVWLHSIENNGLDFVDLNDERLECFRILYDENSTKHIIYESNIKKYEREKGKENPILDIFENKNLLPILYYGEIPEELKDKYDCYTYSIMMYKKIGIEILGEKDFFLYDIELPSGYIINYDGFYGKVLDENGNVLIDFYRDDKYYDRKAHVLAFHDKIEEKKLRKRM